MSRRLVEDEVEDANREANPVVRLMFLVDVLLTSSMAMSRNCLGVRVDLNVEEEGMMLSHALLMWCCTFFWDATP